MVQTFWNFCFCFGVLVAINCSARHVVRRKQRDEKNVIPSTTCAYYNRTMCVESNGEEGCGTTVTECGPEDENPWYCYAMWERNETTNETNVLLKGCFLNNVECVGRPLCQDELYTRPRDYLFCCCEGNYCNTEVSWNPIPTTPPTETTPTPVDNAVDITQKQKIHRRVYSTIIIVASCILLLLCFWCIWMYRKYIKEQTIEGIPIPDGLNPYSIHMQRPIKLVEVKAQGTYGAVWKALYNNDPVAVKIFSRENKKSWLVEQAIYEIPYFQHENILTFIGAEKHVIKNVKREYWLITEYHENGSLKDYLRSNVLTWNQLTHIALSMVRGLKHLHEEISSVNLGLYKPAITHRDFKSSNILLKHDLTACIADFGLALVFQTGKACGRTSQGQVGTKRYMAPEVLERAVNFSKEAFTRIDMYACGLVLWELATRCILQEGVIPDYKLPFEEELGPNPTLKDMLESVTYNKIRPALKASWKSYPCFEALCNTIEDCWDHDAEARISAACVEQRIERTFHQDI